MVQDEKGLFSRCVCPECLNSCNACLGTPQRPLTREALAELARQRALYDAAQADAPIFGDRDDAEG